MQLGSITSRIKDLMESGSVTQVATTTSLPAGVPELSIDEAEKRYGRPWYKRWWVWAIAGTAVVGGIGLTLYLKKRR